MIFAVDQKGEPMLKVPYGQDPYSVIGKYIRDHITVIEDIIAVIEIDAITTNQLFMVDMNEENYFIWDNDWYEGEKDVALIDFFPVSEAINQSAQPEPRWIPVTERLPEDEYVLISKKPSKITGSKWSVDIAIRTADPRSGKIQWRDSGFGVIQDDKVLAWMPRPKPYREEGEVE